MRRHGWQLPALILTAAFWLQAAPLAAQGLIWSIPEEDGIWVRYQGTYKLTQERPDASEGALEVPPWLAELTIKSVGKEDVDGVDCRWIEMKLVIGYESAEGIAPGPFGTRIYKVLVPVEKVVGGKADQDGIPATFVPIIKGYRKIGASGEVQPLNEKVLAVYPMLSHFTYYKNLEADEGTESVDLPKFGAVETTHYKGSEVQESERTRSTNEGEIWLTKDVPFGWAKYQVKLVREEKEPGTPRTEFRKVAEVNVEMKAVDTGDGAQAELPDM